MDGLTGSLIAVAAAVAVSHALLGPDHYLPFILISRARGWSAVRTSAVTALCGAGHVLSSLMLGSVGLALGFAAGRLEWLENMRAGLAGWAVVAFGLAYGIWGTRRAVRRKRGLEPHTHGGRVHVHRRGNRPHDHAHATDSSTTVWALFLVFVLGPCEPLIPLFLLPASLGRWRSAMVAAVVFSVVTIATMVGATLLGMRGLGRFSLGPFERWSHAVAGGLIAVSGLALLLFGL